jgi:hypothetical protein
MSVPTTTGIYPDVSREEYDEIDRINWSTVKQFGRSAQHVLEALRGKTKDSDALRFGRVTAIATLEPHLLETTVAVWNGADKRTKEGKAAWAAFEETLGGREVVDREEMEKCRAIAKAVRTHPVASKYVTGGAAELTVLWDHVAFDGSVIQCKARLDYQGVALVDLKSAQQAGPEAFARACWNFGYHGQAAMYSDGLVAAGGKSLPYVLIAVEKESPFAVAVYTVPHEILERGRATYRSYLDRLAVCRKSGEWPGYGEKEIELTLPQWTNNLADGVAI